MLIFCNGEQESGVENLAYHIEWSSPMPRLWNVNAAENFSTKIGLIYLQRKSLVLLTAMTDNATLWLKNKPRYTPYINSCRKLLAGHCSEEKKNPSTWFHTDKQKYALYRIANDKKLKNAHHTKRTCSNMGVRYGHSHTTPFILPFLKANNHTLLYA